MSARFSRHGAGRGQALVEFSLAVTVFLLLVMAIVDFGRGIYMYNGVSQAAREVEAKIDVSEEVDPRDGKPPGKSPGRPACTPAAPSARAQTRRTR